ncbi:MAG: hypothetical protein NUV88_02030 [Candidatus Kaiserbacteria bacterium]|nr:hypothetical protein [Candidatus Kaiserbacteria bacterium]
MSWASRRRSYYFLGFVVFISVTVVLPLFSHFYKLPSCNDGNQNQGETAPDKGGPCTILDERALAPVSILWARSFEVRPGSYSAVAYIENSNKNAGVRSVGYKFGLYDSQNLLVAERVGTTFIMPDSITPVFEANINAGNRIVTHTYLEFTEPRVWERAKNPATAIAVINREVTAEGVGARAVATIENKAVSPLSDPSFVVVVFDPSGTAHAASMTSVARLDAGTKQQIIFTWPDPFKAGVGRVDMFALMNPAIDRAN